MHMKYIIEVCITQQFSNYVFFFGGKNLGNLKKEKGGGEEDCF